MKKRNLYRQEQFCISECIQKYWSHTDLDAEDDGRDQKYEQCLTSCNICG